MDIEFGGFDWELEGSGDLAVVTPAEGFRGLIARWLLTEPNRVGGLGDEEMERRQREDGERLHGCLPWAPDFGAGIKRYLNQPVTEGFLGELRTRIRSGLGELEGVARVEGVEVSVLGSVVTVEWSIVTDFGPLSGRDRLEVFG